MIREFRLPDLGEGLTESEIVSWHVAVGDKVTLNQVIAEVETAKAVVELPSPYEGIVSQLHEAAGTVVEVGAPIVSFDVGGGPEPAAPATGGAATGRAATGGAATARPAPSGGAGAGTAAGIPPATPADGEPLKRTPNLVGYGAVPEKTGRPARRRWITGDQPATPAHGAAAPHGAPAPQGGPTLHDAPTPQGAPAPAGLHNAPAENRPKERPRSTPPVRKLARDLGVDLQTVAGSGPDGLIVRSDVTAAAESQGPPAPMDQMRPSSGPAEVSSPAVPALTGPSTGVSALTAPSTGADGQSAREERIPIAGMRKHTAAAMVSSAFTAPHVTVFLTVDVTASTELLTRLRKNPEFEGVKLTPLTLAAKAACLALGKHPTLNSRWDEAAREIIHYRYVNLGIAAATPRGLMVPNIKDAQALRLRDLAAALGTLTQTARAGKTTPADLAGGTFSISNVGVFGVDAGTPILNPGEAAILALGAVREQPWAYEGTVALRKVMTLSLSFDHRLVDGEQGARFLSDVGTVLAEPAMTLTLI